MATPREDINCKLSAANTPVAGGTHLNPEGSTWDTYNSIHYTDLHPLMFLRPYPLFSRLYFKISFQSAIEYASTLLINSSVAYCIKIKTQILTWPTMTWINTTLPRFPASSISLCFRHRATVQPVIILSNALPLSALMVDCFSFLLSSIPPHFLVLGSPIMWVHRRGTSFFLDTQPKLVQLGVPTPHFESWVSEKKTKEQWGSNPGLSGSTIEQELLQVQKCFCHQLPLVSDVFWAYSCGHPVSSVSYLTSFSDSPLLICFCFIAHGFDISSWVTSLGKPLMAPLPSLGQFPLISPSSLQSQQLH